MIGRDLAAVGLDAELGAASPDGDPGKFTLAGKPARLVPARDGYYLNVQLGWFRGANDLPEISGGPVHFYVFVLKGLPRRYFICDWLQMRPPPPAGHWG